MKPVVKKVLIGGGLAALAAGVFIFIKNRKPSNKDKFGNTFELSTNISPDQQSGYDILINGVSNGAATSVSIGSDGFARATNGYGKNYLYDGSKWVAI